MRFVASDSSYSADYITRLARERKVQALRIGRRWFVDPVSVSSYVEVQQYEQQVRQKHLRQERLREQQFQAKLDSHAKEKTAPHSVSVIGFAVLSILVFGVVLGEQLQYAVPHAAGPAALTAAQPDDLAMSPEVLPVAFSHDSQVFVSSERVIQRPDSVGQWTHVLYE